MLVHTARIDFPRGDQEQSRQVFKTLLGAPYGHKIISNDVSGNIRKYTIQDFSWEKIHGRMCHVIICYKV